jgi:hypothetical protein
LPTFSIFFPIFSDFFRIFARGEEKEKHHLNKSDRQTPCTEQLPSFFVCHVLVLFLLFCFYLNLHFYFVYVFIYVRVCFCRCVHSALSDQLWHTCFQNVVNFRFFFTLRQGSNQWRSLVFFSFDHFFGEKINLHFKSFW